MEVKTDMNTKMEFQNINNMEKKFSPGKWTSINDGVYCEGNPMGTAYINTKKVYYGRKQAEANAKLMAAAPELLRLLQLALSDPQRVYETATANSIAKNHKVTDSLKEKAAYYQQFVDGIKNAIE